MPKIFIEKKYAGKNLNTDFKIRYIIDDEGYLNIPGGIQREDNKPINNFDIITTISYFKSIYPENKQIDELVIKSKPKRQVNTVSNPIIE